MTKEKTKQDQSTEYKPDRQNGQGEHEGVPHTPDEFDALNPKTPPSKAQKRT